METINKSQIAIEVITNLSQTLDKSPTKVAFVGINGYTNSYGEISNNLVNVGASLANAKKKDVETLNNVDVTTYNFDSILLEKGRVELINSLTNPNENRSQGQIDAYTIITNGIKVHNQTGEIYIYGLRVSKKVVKEGEYPVVNSRPLTIAKNMLKKDLKSSKFTQYKISSMAQIKLNGETLMFEEPK